MAFRSTGKAFWAVSTTGRSVGRISRLLAALDHLMAQHRVRRGIRAASRIESLPGCARKMPTDAVSRPTARFFAALPQQPQQPPSVGFG